MCQRRQKSWIPSERSGGAVCVCGENGIDASADVIRDDHLLDQSHYKEADADRDPVIAGRPMAMPRFVATKL